MKPSINLARYRDQVLGCWTGKNVGGTLGAPFEGRQEMQNVSFYTQDLKGTPAPNDDLDLQLIWLYAAERHDLLQLNERILGEYWLEAVIGPWNEYAVGKANMRNGLTPPLSGSCNNARWKSSNGAWIRSEIWACLFPGQPDLAARYAYMDACVDHSGDGIYAELFTAALQSAAFVEKNLRRLIAIALAKIPADCRIARSVKLACDLYDRKADFAEARNAITKDSEDLGWFQAPANVGYTVLGLLYGEGDFGKTVCLAVNCGDDTDCTGATAGAVMGILLGRSGIPAEWIEPIGESIQTVAIIPLGHMVPKTLGSLTERVIRLALSSRCDNPELLPIGDAPEQLPADFLAALDSSEYVAKRIWSKSPWELSFDLPFGRVSIDYDNGPEVLAGETKKITVGILSNLITDKCATLQFQAPGWGFAPANGVNLNCIRYTKTVAELTVTVPEFDGAYAYLPLEVRLAGRNYPAVVHVPFQKRGAVSHNPIRDWDADARLRVEGQHRYTERM